MTNTIMSISAWTHPVPIAASINPYVDSKAPWWDITDALPQRGAGLNADTLPGLVDQLSSVVRAEQ